jgi:hypothetical protein
MQEPTKLLHPFREAPLRFRLSVNPPFPDGMLSKCDTLDNREASGPMLLKCFLCDVVWLAGNAVALDIAFSNPSAQFLELRIGQL